MGFSSKDSQPGTSSLRCLRHTLSTTSYRQHCYFISCGWFMYIVILAAQSRGSTARTNWFRNRIVRFFGWPPRERRTKPWNSRRVFIISLNDRHGLNMVYTKWDNPGWKMAWNTHSLLDFLFATLTWYVIQKSCCKSTHLSAIIRNAISSFSERSNHIEHWSNIVTWLLFLGGWSRHSSLDLAHGVGIRRTVMKLWENDSGFWIRDSIILE